MSRAVMELVFKHSGGVELRRIDRHGAEPNVVSDTLDTVIWASDSDQDFMDAFGNEIMSADEDAEEVMDYLIDAEVLSEDEAEALHLFDESIDGSELEPEDDDDGGEEFDEEIED